MIPRGVARHSSCLLSTCTAIMIGLRTGLRIRRPKAVETRVNRAEGQQRRGLAPDLGA